MTPIGSAKLTIHGLTRPGLSPIDLSVAAGECVAVMGPSGSGKSLFLRAIADLDPCDGEIRLDGRAREEMPAPRWRRQVCYLPAESGWWADRVGDHFPDRAAARAMLGQLGLPDDALAWPVARLSTGEKQRLALIRVLLLQPAVMLLDEPTSGLDADATEQVETVLLQRLNAGAAILLTTHDPAQAARLAHRRLAVSDGHVSEAAA